MFNPRGITRLEMRSTMLPTINGIGNWLVRNEHAAINGSSEKGLSP